MKNFLLTTAIVLVAGIILFPAIGVRMQETEQDKWCRQFETRFDFTREEAKRYLDYCDHFDMKTQTEVKGRLAK